MKVLLTVALLVLAAVSCVPAPAIAQDTGSGNVAVLKNGVTEYQDVFNIFTGEIFTTNVFMAVQGAICRDPKTYMRDVCENEKGDRVSCDVGVKVDREACLDVSCRLVDKDAAHRFTCLKAGDVTWVPPGFILPPPYIPLQPQ